MALVWAILLAGGKSARYGENKLLLPLVDQTVFSRSFHLIHTIPGLDGLVVVAHPDWLEDYQAGIPDGATWVNGGQTRRESVNLGLEALPDTCDVVLVHDAARPLVTAEAIQRVLQPVITGDARASSLGCPVINTIKQVKPGFKPWVDTTPPRDLLWQVHTPQVFETSLLKTAHHSAPNNFAATDDASLVEATMPDVPVLMVEDAPGNIKITAAADYRMARALLDLA